METQRLLVKRGDIATNRLDSAPLPPIGNGEVLVRVGRFALTANNISYALTGEQIGYWRFFPSGADEWGIVPVWGHAEVVESRCDDLPVGARFWGFLPMASHLVMRPVNVSPRGFVDGAAHRDGLPLVYNQYARTEADPPALAAAADLRSLLFPLFTTSYLIADYLADNAMFGAAQVIIGSVSSKTGFGLAHFLRALPAPPAHITGLTSPGNIGFVEGLGLCTSVLSYADIEALDASVPSVYVDMAGNTDVLSRLHHHFGDNMRASVSVGATHWQVPRVQAALPGAKPAFFFAPSQIAKRDAEWGAGEMMRRAGAANLALIASLGDTLATTSATGAQAIAAAYAQMVAGQTPPDKGVILSFAAA